MIDPKTDKSLRRINEAIKVLEEERETLRRHIARQTVNKH